MEAESRKLLLLAPILLLCCFVGISGKFLSPAFPANLHRHSQTSSLPADQVTHHQLYLALGRSGYGAVDIVVAETGWPTKGDPTEAGATVDNARAYVPNLVAHLRSGAGTPLMPGKPVDTYLFALYDEDLKPGPTSERSFGLYHTDLSMAYDAGLTSSGNGAGATVQPKGSGWCVASVAATDAQLQTDMDYACSQVGVDCAAIQPGGACFQPNTVRAHAAYAMNQLYQAAGGHPWNCDFRQSATLTSSNPSYGSCVFTGGGQ